MRRSRILPATSLCLAVALMVVGSLSAALAAGSPDAAPRSSMPADFQAQSMSWISPQRGWMLGLGQCGQVTCTAVVGTTDGGGTWKTLGTLAAPMTWEEHTGVTEIRFADRLHGWAFQPGLYSTTNGGRKWIKERPPGGGHLVLALAADSSAAYAVVSPCRLNRLCKVPATLWRSTPGQGSWTQVDIALPIINGFNTAILAVHGTVAYVSVPAPLDGPLGADELDVTLDGEHWSSRPDPCKPSKGVTLTGLAPISDTKVALLCQANIGFGKAVKHVLRSKDTGETTRSAGTMPLYGITSQMTASHDGTLLVASYSIGSWIYRNASGRTWTTPVDLGDGGMGWNDVVLVTNRIGYVIHGAYAYCCRGGPGELWKTEDGGVTWFPV